MKKIFTLLVVTTIYLNANAQTADTIPNAGFERWVNFGGWYYNPKGWSTNNTQLSSTGVVEDSDSYSGNLAMKLISFGGVAHPLASCGFKIQHHPLSLDGYMKDQIIPAAGDSATISVRLYYQNQITDSGSLVIFGGINPNYIPFTVPISQSSANIDSCEIEILGGMQLYSSITLDQLSFSLFNATSVNINQSHFAFYPNPVSNNLTITLLSPSLITISNLLGQQVCRKDSNQKMQIDVSSFPNGIYFLHAQSANEMKEEKFVIQH